MTHSKGPWQFVPDEFNTEKQDGQPGSIYSVGGWFIATVESIPDEGETEANAQLIAAAPDLLEVAELINSKIDNDLLKFIGLEGQFHVRLSSQEIEVLRTAIKKAKGDLS